MNPVCRMHSRFFLLTLTLLFTGCATMTTTTLKPTDTVRNSAVAEKSAAIRFQEREKPSTTSPNLEITVLRQVTQEETFQRRYVEKKVLKPGARTALWLVGAATVGGGYILYKEAKGISERRDDHVRYWTILNQRLKNETVIGLGRNLMGLGALIPLGSEMATAGLPPVGEEWKEESRTLPVRTIPASNTDIVASAGSSSWSVQTDNDGQLVVDVSTLVDMADPGKPLAIHFALQEDTSQSTTVTIPASVLDSHRPAPPAIVETDVEPVVPVAAAPPSVEFPSPTSRLTLAILDFEGLGISEQDARVLTNRLGTHMVQLGRYQVIERGQMQQVLQEQDFQLTGCTSDECAVEIGQLLGVQQMLAGSFGKIESMYLVDMRIIDVKTGGILRTASYEVTGGLDLLIKEGLVEAAKRIAGVD